MSLDAVYSAKILNYAGNIGRIGTLAAPDGAAKAHSKLCGSTVRVEVKTDGEVVTDFAQDVKACALGQASAAILANSVIGRTLPELEKGQAELRAMLKEDGPAPKAPFEELQFLEPVKAYRARHASTMLAFDAVVDAMRDALQNRAAA